MPSSSQKASIGRRQLDVVLSRRLATKIPPRPARGWVSAVRSALGMTSRQLAARMGMRQPSLIALEKAEAAGTISLNTLRRAAEALDCELAYVLIPRTSLDETVRRRARAIAEAHVAATSHSMDLEGQGIRPHARAAEVRQLANALLNDGSRLWEEQ